MIDDVLDLALSLTQFALVAAAFSLMLGLYLGGIIKAFQLGFGVFL